MIEKLSNDEADKMIEDVLSHIESSLAIKGKEYVRNDDRLHNFNVAAKKKDITREQAIDGMRLKHEISIDDMRNDIANGILPTKEMVDEKFGDIINYYILEKMSILHRIKNLKKDV